MSRESIISDNEAQLKLFYSSSESETTQKYKFIEVNAPVTFTDSEIGIGVGVFSNNEASAGQLLLVSNAEVSCTCTVHDSTLYDENSYAHAPKAVVFPPSPRIPSEVHSHLMWKLKRRLSTTDDFQKRQLSNLDSHQPGIASFSGKSRDSNPDRSLPLQKGENSEDRLHRQAWNIIANNAFCDKVRSFNPNKPSRVETSDLWGLWLLPSYINHSCSPNCNRMRVGDALFIRAVKTIAAGDELTLPYFDIFEPLRIREVHCDRFGFRCHCRRCTFERSLGKPYNDIQMEIVRHKYSMRRVWTTNGTEKDEINSLLEALDRQTSPILDLVAKIRSDQDSRQDDLAPLEASTSLSDQLLAIANEMQQNGMEEQWVHASFIDAYIAALALCKTRPSRPGDTFYSLPDRFCRGGGPASQTSEEAQAMLRVEAAATVIFEIVSEVHPGNMLGQEIFDILVTASRRFANYDLEENLTRNLQHLRGLECDGIHFLSSYYGFPGGKILRSLLISCGS